MTGKIQQIRDLTFTVAVLAALALFGYREIYPPETNPAASVNAAKLAKVYAPEILDTFGDAYIAAAAKVETPGAKMSEVLKVKQDTWDSLRTPRFNQLVGPSFSTILPEGTEPSDAQRPMVAKLYRDFGTAMKKASGK